LTGLSSREVLIETGSKDPNQQVNNVSQFTKKKVKNGRIRTHDPKKVVKGCG
jgi:hypothetical protein